MALSDCVKYWSTPCEHGYEYRDWSVKRLKGQIKMLKHILAQKVLHEDDIRESKLGKPHFKRPLSEEEKKDLRNTRMHLVKCPHCSKEGSMMIMKRWHFDNCKSKG